MATQDRNMHRDAESAVQKISVAIPAGVAVVDTDEPFWFMEPRFNHRLKDLVCFAGVVATADAIVRALITPTLSAMGSAEASGAAATTFTLEAFWQNVAGVPTSRAADAAVAFTAPFTVIDGGWGVFITQVDAAGVVTTKAPSGTMGYATEAQALAACPKPDLLNGHVNTVVVEAVGADWVAGTSNTGDANTFLSRGRTAHGCLLPIAAGMQSVSADQGELATDRAGVSLMNGRALGSDDLLSLTLRSAGATVITEGSAQVSIRPFPIQGEGLQGASSSQTGPFVP